MTEERDYRFMRVARSVRRLSTCKVQVGCIATMPNAYGYPVIVASAWNIEEPLKAHAEMGVLGMLIGQRPNWQRYRLTLYVTTQPCKQCTEAIITSEIVERIFYQDPWWDEAGIKMLWDAGIEIKRLKQIV